jgi:hypothetical protein
MKWVSRVNEPAVEMPCSLSCCLCSVLLKTQAIKITKTKKKSKGPDMVSKAWIETSKQYRAHQI